MLAPDPETPEMLAPDPETQDAHDSDLQAKEFDVPDLQSIDPGSKFTGYSTLSWALSAAFTGVPPLFGVDMDYILDSLLISSYLLLPSTFNLQPYLYE